MTDSRPSASHLSYRHLLDALPLPVFVVDSDIRIFDLNQAAVEFCRGTKVDLQMRRGGDVLQCLHATDSREGCGRGPSCGTCVVRNVVAKCLLGSTVRRRRFRMEIVRESQRSQLELLLTASPVTDANAAELALLIVEDITELSTLKDLIPICMSCKKIRDDEKLWRDVDAYFHQYVGVDFTHGVCPSCRQDFLG